MKIAIFYHCLFYFGDPPELQVNALNIVLEQMGQLQASGLEDAASEIIVGVNGGEESVDVAKMALPRKARLVFHGLQSRAENLTIIEIEKWAPNHPDWYICYFHSKGATHAAGSAYGENVSAPWRRGMMADLVMNWRQCVADLDAGAELCCSHFMRNMADGTQHIAAGNFWWAKAAFLNTLPTMYLRERIKMSGIASAESRYEAEVWICNGPRLPNVKEYRPGGGGGVP